MCDDGAREFSFSGSACVNSLQLCENLAPRWVFVARARNFIGFLFGERPHFKAILHVSKANVDLEM